jgi:hypothetical protein
MAGLLMKEMIARSAGRRFSRFSEWKGLLVQTAGATRSVAPRYPQQLFFGDGDIRVRNLIKLLRLPA